MIAIYHVTLSKELGDKITEIMPPTLQVVVDLNEEILTPKKLAHKFFSKFLLNRDHHGVPHNKIRIHDVQWVSPTSEPINEERRKAIARELLFLIRPDFKINPVSPP